MKDLVDIHFRDGDTIVIKEDNLNTHTPASLYAAFPPQEAKRIGDRLEFHYTPKHGSWLNMAELELTVLSRQCLDRRIPNQPTFIPEVAAWETRLTAHGATVHWRFTTPARRI